jgi:tetratricopeptide (TPR) repeat protein
MDTQLPRSARVARLLTFVERDPANLSLIADAATAAFDEQAYDLASSLMERYKTLAPLPSPLKNLDGMTAMARQDYAGAAATFEQLRTEAGDNPALRFNLAWASAMMGAYAQALELLDDDVVGISPRAPALKIHAMHHLGMYDEALASGEHLAGRFPDNQALMGALATLALDAEKPDLAARYAERAGGNPEGRAALGFLALGNYETGRSLELFDDAIAQQPDSPRAWVGKGLGLLATGDARAGAEAIDRGAALFGDHIGSWIASGWAHFTRSDYVKARQSFERALAIDPNFSESHGGLAVVDIMDGRMEDAKRRCDIALRLDRNCFGGALAKSLLLETGGRPDAAQHVRDIAFATPVGPNGQTLAQAIVAMSSRLGR